MVVCVVLFRLWNRVYSHSIDFWKTNACHREGGGAETMSHLYLLLYTPHKLSKMTWNSRMKVLIPFYKRFFQQNTNISNKRKINCQLSVIITFRTITSGSPPKVDFGKNQRELVPNINSLRLRGGGKLLWCFGPGIVWYMLSYWPSGKCDWFKKI